MRPSLPESFEAIFALMRFGRIARGLGEEGGGGTTDHEKKSPRDVEAVEICDQGYLLQRRASFRRSPGELSKIQGRFSLRNP